MKRKMFKHDCPCCGLEFYSDLIETECPDCECEDIEVSMND